MLCKKLWVLLEMRPRTESVTDLQSLHSGFNYGLPLLCVAWGLVCTFQGFVHNYGGLAAARMSTKAPRHESARIREY